MKLKTLGEFGLIDRIAGGIGRRGADVVVGLGDDAAAVRTDARYLLLATTDMMVEGVHFDLSYTSYFSLGWKAMCSNMSDCAAMGGAPRHALVSFGVPATTDAEDIDELYEGMKSLASRHGVELIGGDTVSSPKAVVLNIALLGRVKRSEMLLRSTAKPGDLILMTGDAGSSSAGLEVLKKKRRRRVDPKFLSLMRAHLMPEPRLKEARAIAGTRLATSMIDNSDGIARCVTEICRMSGAGAEIYTDSIPVSVATKLFARSAGKTGAHYALYGGEDYELVFTAAASDASAIAKKVTSMTGTCVTQIGRITDRRDSLCLVDEKGRRTGLENAGFDHFRRMTR